MLGRPPGSVLLAEREIDFEAELSVIVARAVDGSTATFPIARNVHDAGILFESVAPAPVDAAIAAGAADIGLRLAAAMDLVGTLTAELFLLRDGSLVVNELAPRVHNSGHWTIEGAATSQFEQHIRAICGLGLGSTDALSPTAMANLLGAGPQAAGAADRGGRRARGSRRPPASVRQAAGLRTPQDGARHGARPDRGRGPDPSPHRARRARLGRGPDEAGGSMSDGAKAGSPLVGVVGGSRSDFPTLEAAVAVLDELGVASELKVVSAHRTPDHLFRYAEGAAGRGIKVIVAGAGGAAHLPGMLAAKTALPVIGVPIPTQHLGGLDSLLSIVQMPRGVPVATVAIGNATNAGLLAASILALSDAGLAERLAAWRARQTESVMDDPSNAGS